MPLATCTSDSSSVDSWVRSTSTTVPGGAFMVQRRRWGLYGPQLRLLHLSWKANLGPAYLKIIREWSSPWSSLPLAISYLWGHPFCHCKIQWLDLKAERNSPNFLTTKRLSTCSVSNSEDSMFERKTKFWWLRLVSRLPSCLGNHLVGITCPLTKQQTPIQFGLIFTL